MRSGSAIEIIFWLERGEAATAAAQMVYGFHAMDTEIPATVSQFLIRIMPSRQ